MRFIKTLLLTVFLAGGVAFMSACGGVSEPPATGTQSLVATATPRPGGGPTPDVGQLSTPATDATPAAPPEATSAAPGFPEETATPIPSGVPPATRSTATLPPTVAPDATPAPTATFTPAPPTVTPAPTVIPPDCSHLGQGLSGSAARVTVDLTGNSIARFRVREQFARVNLPNDAVGQTRDVSGSMVFDSSGVVLAGQSKITVNLLSLQSDDDERDEFLRTDSLESERFPLAELVVRETLGLPWPIPCQGETVFQIVGDMTVHGVTASLIWDATVQFRPDGVSGLMKTSFPFSTFDMKRPKKLFLLSVDDNIRLELQFDAPIAASP